MNQLRRLQSLSGRRLVLLTAFGVLLIGGISGAGIALSRRGGAPAKHALVTDFGPTGDAAAPLAPLTATFSDKLDCKRVQRALKIEPPAPGAASCSGTSLTYRPAWPGFAPGQTYRVRIDPSAGLQKLAVWSFKTSGDLAVQFTSPAAGDSEVDSQAVVTLQFNRPVAALTALARAAPKTVVVFDPPVSGAGKWLTSSLYTFRPDQGLQPSTSYKVRVLQDLSNEPGGALASDFAFAFTTIQPAVGDEFPRDNTQFVDPSGDVRVLFNQAMDQGAAQAVFSLSRADQAVQGAFNWADPQTLVFKPAVALERGTAYTATVAVGAKSATGAGQSPRPFSWRFTTAPMPAVVKTDPVAGPGARAAFGMSITFSTPMDHDSTEAAVTIDPTPDKDDPPTFFWGPDTQLRINYGFKPSSPYMVSVGTGAKDRFDEPLGAPFAVTFTTAQRDASLNLVTAGFGASAGTLNASVQQTVYTATVNVQRASFTLYSVPQADYIAFVSGRQSNLQAYLPPAGSTLRSWNVTIGGQTNITAVTPIILGEGVAGAIDGKLPPGFYLLEAVAAGTQATRSLVEITGTNLVVKRSASSVLVWAADLASGQPVANTPVNVVDATGSTLASGTTGGDGVYAGTFTHPLPQQGRQAVYVSLSRQGDVAFATDDWNNSASPFSFGFPTSLFGTQDLRAYMYTDRPIYRTGETVHTRAVVRADSDGAYSLPASLTGLTIEVRDSRGQVAQTAPVSLDGFGATAFDFTIPEEGATGGYSINLNKAMGSANSSFVTSTSFLVAEFRPPEFQVDLKADKSEYTNGATISATVQADLFFGSPLSDAKVSWQANASPYTFRPKDMAYTGYNFSDPDAIQAQRPAPKALATGDIATDAQGRAVFTVPAQVGDFPTSETFNLSATVTDKNRQQVSASTAVVVHKAGVYAGVKPRQYLFGQGQAAALDAVTLDTTGKPAGTIALKADVYLRTWLTAKKRDADGSERYVSTPNDSLVETQNLTTDATGKAVLSFTPAKGGQYRIVLSGRDSAGNPFTAAASLYVTASEALSWRVNNNDKLDLVTDKTQYVPGDVAHVLVPAPFGGTKALVTIERGRVITHDVRDFASNSAVVDVPITADMAPTVYLSVALLRPGASEDSVASFKLGYAQLAVNPEAHTLKVTLTPDKTKLGPGDTVSVALTTADVAGKPVSAELSLALVDQAILSLADERGPAIFDAFYGPRALGVATGGTLGVSINVANQALQLSQAGGKGGGGGGDDGSSGNIRSRFENTAYWKADVQTDANGKATVSVKLPDNLTTWRLNVRGVTVDTMVGDATTTMQTTRDLVLRPVAPRFFTAGDRAHLEALINNRTDHTIEATVTLKAEGLTVSGGPQKAKVAPGQSGSVGWDTTAGDAGEAKVTWEATAEGGLGDGAQLSLPIKDRTTPETTMTAGVLTAGDVTENVVVPGFARGNSGGVTIQLSPTLDSLLQFARRYIEEWPYEPVDVVAARLLDRVANWQVAVKLQKDAKLQSDAKEAAVRAVGRLIGAQAGDGGWSWWQGGVGDPSITGRVLFALGAAKQAGLTVDTNVLQRATKFLTDYYNRPTDALHPADPNGRAFLLLALAASGSGSRDRERALADQRAALGSSGKGALLQALLLDGAAKDDPTVRAITTDLQSAAIASATGAHWEDAAGTTTSVQGVAPSPGSRPPDTNSTRATALVLAGLIRLDSQQPLLDSAMRWLAGTRSDGHWRSVDETGLAVNAVAAYLVAREQPVIGLTYTVTVGGKAVDVGGPTRPDREGSASVPLTGLSRDTNVPVQITKQGSGQLYYGIGLRYFLPSDTVSALSNGITVGREVLPADSETPVTAVKAGDLVRIRLTVIAPSDLQLVRVEDALPAGLEAIDGSLKTTDPNLLRRQAEDLQRALQQGLQRGQVPQLSLVSDLQRRLFNPFTHAEVRDDRVALFAESLSRGVHEYIYYARATTPGTFTTLPVTATESNYPDVFGRSDSTTLTVTP